MKRGRDVPLSGGGEYDAHTGWRHVLSSYYKQGAKYWKRKYNKRERKLAKESLNGQDGRSVEGIGG